MPEQVTKHTKGPWEVSQDFYIKRPGKVHSLAEVKCGDVAADAIEEHKANARLIAAAPDLLSACEAMLSAIENHRVPQTAAEAGVQVLLIFGPVIEQARAAIAKARGQAEPDGDTGVARTLLEGAIARARGGGA